MKTKTKDLYKQMLEFQKQIKPFTPTIRELRDLWGANSTSVVRYHLDKMIEMGKVVTRKHGKYNSYYAVTK